MILTIDIGNSNIVMGIYFEGQIVSSIRIKSDRMKSPDGYYHSLSDFFRDRVFEVVCISSVVPVIGASFEQMINRFLKIPYLFVNSSIDLGLKYLIPDPSKIGADLIVNAFSALQKYKTSAIICDLGTATTIQLVASDGTFIGVVIMPGIKSALDGLISNAALLSPITLTSPPLSPLGTNTSDCILIGSIRGHAYTLDGFIADIKKEYSHLGQIKTIITGGLSWLMVPYLQSEVIHEENLLLDGLAMIASQRIGDKG